MLPAGLPAQPRQRRALALALLAVALGALWFGIAGPVLEDLSARQEQAARQDALLVRLERLRAAAPAFRQELDGLEAELSGPDFLIRAPTSSQAAAVLQAALRAILDAEGLAADSTQALAAAPQGPLLRVGLRVEFRGGLDRLYRVVRAIEAHRPYLVIGDAMIAAPAAGAETLAVRLDVLGLARVGAAGGG